MYHKIRNNAGASRMHTPEEDVLHRSPVRPASDLYSDC